MLHDVVEDTDITAEEIEKEFGPQVRFLCEGVGKVSKVRLSKKDKKSHQFENIQKLFVALAQDIRVIFVKLADRIHNLETLNHIPERKHGRIAQESLQVYAPIAEKLGLFEFKTKIEDLCFKFLDPEKYGQLAKEIASFRKEKETFVEKAKKDLLKTFAKEKIEVVEISGRQKNLASVYGKMKRKDMTSVAEVFDLMGIRILVPSNGDCYRALGVLHSFWRPIPDRFKDYISVPKPNGYQSLHTTLLGLSGSKLPTEIQIRTPKMHTDAELGPAAHWAYKKVKHSHFSKDYLKRTDWLPKIISDTGAEAPEKFFEEISENVLSDRIYVFTPKGETKFLQEGATPVDFAYSVHSEIGDSCIGARVNGTIKPLDYKLHNGDVVEIQTRKGRLPNPAWLDFVKSSHARNHIKNIINREKEKHPLLKEKEKITFVPKLSTTPQKIRKIFTKNNQQLVVISGQRNIPHKFASCCAPRAGGGIVAYKSRGLDFTIHRDDCEELNQLDSKRFMEAHFLIEQKIELKAFDRIGLAQDYTQIIAHSGVNISHSSVHQRHDDEKNRIANCELAIEFNSPQEIPKLLRELKKIRGVFFVKELT